MKKILTFALVLVIALFSIFVIPMSSRANSDNPPTHTERVFMSGHWYLITYDSAGGPIEVVIDDPNH